ncbi:ABC transporter substrate-binding protein [Ktedonosporobacter rubrisoli]|nr:extracellular solute-binding protein [Ktedonosporobacter rubrisoli]
MKEKLCRRTVLKLGAAGLAAAGLTLAGCNGGAGSSKTADTVTIVTWGSDKRLRQSFQAVSSAFPNDFQHFKLNIVVAGGGDPDVTRSLRLALAAHKNIPDIVRLNYNEIAEFAQAGVLHDLKDVIEPIKDDLYIGAQKLAMYQGKYVAIPEQVKSKMFYYRADLFEQLHITPGDLNTIDGLIASAQKLHERFPKTYLFNMGQQPSGTWLSEIISAYPNISMAEPSGNYVVTSAPAFSSAFSFIKRLHDSGTTLQVDDFSTDWGPAFKNGRIAGALNANWLKLFLPEYATVDQAGKWKAALWPDLLPLVDQSYGSEAGGSVFVIPEEAPNKEQAILFLRRLILDKKGALAQFKANSLTPLLRSAQPDLLTYVHNASKPSDVSDEQWALQPHNFFGKDFYTQELASYDRVRIFNYDPSALKEFAILNQWLNQFVQGKADLKASLAGAQHDMETQIGNPYKS